MMTSMENRADLTDGQLVRLTLIGDKDAFGALVRKYERMVYAMAFQRVKNMHDALELTNGVLMKAHNSLKTLKNPDKLGSWLAEITVNQCTDLLRKRRAAPVLFPGNAETLAEIPDRRESDSAGTRNDTCRAVLSAIDALPEAYQLPLMLHLMEEFDVDTISVRLDIPRETIRKQIYRGIQMLRERLKPQLQGEIQ